MIIYEDKDDIKLVQPVASASTLISSVAGSIRDFIMSRFPKNYFRHVYIDSEETSVEHYKNKKYNDTVNKIPYPSLSIGTEISLDDPVGGMQKPLSLSSTNLFIEKDLRRTYKKLLADPSFKFNMYFSSDYITTNFNFRIAVKKYIQSIDLAYYIKSRFQTDFFQYLNGQELNTEMPKTFVKTIADYKGLDMTNQDDFNELQTFLAQASTQDTYVRCKKNLSTGKDCFFFGHNVNLLMYVTDLDSPPSIIRNRMNDDEYITSFRVQVSTWLPNSFILSIKNEVMENLSETTYAALRMSNDSTELSDGYLAITRADVDREFHLGRQLQIEYLNSSNEKVIAHEISNQILTYRVDDLREDMKFSFFEDARIPIRDDVIKVHNFLKNYEVSEDDNSFFRNMEISDVFQMRYLTKNRESDMDEPVLDYDDLSITIKSDFQEEVMVSLYVDRLALAAILKAIKTNKWYFNDNAMAVIKITIAGEEIPIRVYSFEDEIDYLSNDPLKSVRVQTIYGIGYVGLVDETDASASEYKLCIGYTEKGTPIIKCFEIETEN